MRYFTIGAAWWTRLETPEQIAQRLRSLISALRPIHPHFARWYQVISEDNVPELDGNETWLADAIAGKVCTDELGAPAPLLGHLFVTMNAPANAPMKQSDVFINSVCGSKYTNFSELHSTHMLDWDPTLLAYPVVKQTVLAFAKAFEPHFCDASPYELFDEALRSRYKSRPVMLPCWMIHLPPALAQRVMPPSDLVSERFDDESLFMAATDETFDPANAAHIDAAQRLFAVLDPLQEKYPPEQWRR